MYNIVHTYNYTGRIFKMEERKAPHVLRHFTFGARLMGLSEKELTRRQQATLHTVAKNSNKDSPFAKPLFRIDKRPHTEELSKWKGTGKIRLSVIVDKVSNGGKGDGHTGVADTLLQC